MVDELGLAGKGPLYGVPVQVCTKIRWAQGILEFPVFWVDDDLLVLTVAVLGFEMVVACLRSHMQDVEGSL